LAAVFQFGIGRIANNHYMLGTSAAPLAMLMTRKRFESLPVQAQGAIRKYSGQWLAERYSREIADETRKLLDQLRIDPKRKVVMPSPSDLGTASAAFTAISEAWAASSSQNKDLLDAVRSEIRKVRQAY
jgi:TRAP-type C4-dicarboxylate transport system substrate-binding protein